MKKFLKPSGTTVRNYKRFVLAIAILLLVMIAFIQYIMSYGVFSYNLRTVFRYYASISVEKAIVDTQQVLNEYQNLAIKINMDEDMRKLWIGYNIDEETRKDCLEKFEIYFRDTQYSDEIYIYDDVTENVYTRRNIMKTVFEADVNVQELIKNRKEGVNFDFIIDVDEKSYSNVAYIIYYPMKNLDNAVIIKPDFQKFKDIFDSIAFSHDGHLWITDETGKIYYGNDDFGGEEAFREIFEAKNNYKVLKRNGQTWMFYKSYEKMLDRYFVFGIWENAIADHLHLQKGLAFFGILIVVLALVLLSAIFISNFFTGKIEMIKLKAAVEKDDFGKDIHEFAAIENILGMSVFSSNIFDADTIYNLYELGISFTKPIALVMLQIVDYDEFSARYTDEKERENFKYYVISVICHKLRENVQAQGIRLENDRMLLFVNDTENHIKDYAAEMLGSIGEYTDIEFNVFAAEATDYKQLGAQYKDLEELMKYRFNHDDAVLSTDILKKLVLIDYSGFEGYINRINNFIMFGDIENAREQNKVLFDILKNTDVNQSKAVTFELAEKVKSAVEKAEEKYSITVVNKRLMAMRKVLEIKSLGKVYDAVTEILDELEEAFEKRKNSAGNLPVEQIKSYVEANYFRHDLGIEVIAKQFGFSATYIGRVFQKEYGDTLTNLITNVRIEKAVQLLENTGEPIADIADKVGFGSSSYMGVQFKKKYGISPGEFRKNTKSE